MSKGFTQLKDDENLSPSIKKEVLKNDSDLLDPKKAGVASFYSLSSKYLYLKDVAKKSGASVSQADLVKLAMLSWNESIKTVGESLVKYKDYDTIIQKYRTNIKTGKVTGHPYDNVLSMYEKGFVLNSI